jgi:hypothetical protein
VPLLFAATLFVSAFLLFLVEPLIAHMILPLLGGTPAVWNTCMVFFQAALLAGYGYAHSATTYWSLKRQVVMQIMLLVLPLVLLILPIRIGSWTPATEVNPIWSMLYVLLVCVGLPFLVIATSAPLLQRWFVATGHPSGKDPYFLYGASNAGSMLALITYPLLTQRYFELPTQSQLWMFGYLGLILLVGLCGYVAWKAPAPPLVTLPAPAKVPQPSTHVTAAAPAPVPQQAVTRKAGGKRMRARPVLAAAGAPAAAAVAVPQNLKPLVLAGGMVLLVALASVAVLAVGAFHLPSSLGPLIPIVLLGTGAGLVAAPSIAREARSGKEVIWLRRLRWVALSAVPSSLMLGVTTYLTTDIAAIPLFWVVPLALYLLSFILVFARWPVLWTDKPHRFVVYSQPVILLVASLFMFAGFNASTWMVITAHLAAFFSCVMLCHGELAKDRPPPQYLTEFFLWMSVGGVVGGLFNAFLAPLLFKHLIEYFIMLVAALLLRPQTHFWAWFRKQPEPPPDHSMQEYLLDLGYAACLGLLAFALLRLSLSPKLWPGASSLYEYLVYRYDATGMRRSSSRVWALWTELALVEGIPLAICLCFAGRPVRLGLAAGCLVVANTFMLVDESNIIYSNRSFFSVQRVRKDETKHGNYHVLIHGGIDHGRQNLDPAIRDRPISYFYPTNPIGQIFTSLKHLDELETETGARRFPDRRRPSQRPYAVVGLGIGTLASYGNKGQVVDFYEIDPAVLLLSEPTDGSEPFFWYLRDAKARGVKLDVKLGDGRLKITEAPEKYYQVIVLDAFSSDAIPVHLMTTEAVGMYLTKLRDDGILIFNITNRYVDLAPILADVARAHDLVCLYQGDYYDERVPDKFASDWVIMFPKKNKQQQVQEAMFMLQGGPGLGVAGSVPWTSLARLPQFDWTDPLTTRLALYPKGTKEPDRYRLSARALDNLRSDGVAEATLAKLHKLQDQVFLTEKAFTDAIGDTITKDEWDPIRSRLWSRAREGSWVYVQPSGRPPWTDHFSDLLRAMRW